MSYRKHLMTSDEPPSELYKAVELSTDLAEVGTDCISRQAAIDALDEIEAEVADGYGYQYAKWREYFAKMPPARPQIIRCRDCRHRDEFGCCKYWVGLTMGMPTTATDDDDFCSYAERREVPE